MNSAKVDWTIAGKISVSYDTEASCGPTSCIWEVTQINPPNITVSDATVCSIEPGGKSSIVDLNVYASAPAGTLVFEKLMNENKIQIISGPLNYLANSGDIIQVSLAGNGICTTVAKTFTITVADRQTFGVCAPVGARFMIRSGQNWRCWSANTTPVNLYNPIRCFLLKARRF